jgi:hypothetical protein
VEIGGNDLVIETPIAPQTQRDVLLAYLKRHWPQGVLEDDEGLDFFYYRDQASREAWDNGEQDTEKDLLVYALPRPGQITIVHPGLNVPELQLNFFDHAQFL